MSSAPQSLLVAVISEDLHELGKAVLQLHNNLQPISLLLYNVLLPAGASWFHPLRPRLDHVDIYILMHKHQYTYMIFIPTLSVATHVYNYCLVIYNYSSKTQLNSLYIEIKWKSPYIKIKTKIPYIKINHDKLDIINHRKDK